MVRPSVRVRLFATARRAAGWTSRTLPVSRAGVTVAELVDRLRSTWPALVPVLRTSRFVRNGAYLESLEVRLRPGDELSVHPPYGGG